MTSPRKFAAVLLATLAGAAAIVFSLYAQPQGQIPMPAQQPAPAAPAFNRNLIVIDPAHGGPDPGATLAPQVLEKDVTLAFALKLRAALAAANFTVAITRDANATDPLTPDQRAEIANRTHAVACIVLHVTASGSGLHLYTSTLQPPAPHEDFGSFNSAFVPVPWDMAQAAFVSQSQRLAASLSSALIKNNLPTLSGQAALRPLDNLMCPAVAVEIAPLLNPGDDPTAPTDAAYQQRLIAALTSSLQSWRDQADPQAASTETSAQSHAIAAANSAGAATATGAPGLASETWDSRQHAQSPTVAPPTQKVPQ